MLFTSHIFIFIFLPISVISTHVASVCVGKTAGKVALIGFSLFFYAANSYSQLYVLLLSIIINYIAVKYIFDGKKYNASKLVTTLILVNVSLLAFYKYAIFLERIYEQFVIIARNYSYKSDYGFDAQFKDIYGKLIEYNALYPWGHSGLFIALPLAISLFTFQQISYILDVGSGKVKSHNFFDYVLCVTFFPHLIAGPIVNYRELIPQFHEKRVLRMSYRSTILGMSIFAIGLAKKDWADYLSVIANSGFNVVQGEMSTLLAWKAAIAYTFQIYFDFSGYSDMAIGIAALFGIRLPMNFYSPYKSTSIIEFWRLWHITLSRFLRQYIYMPMGGGRVSSIKKIRNLMFVMLVGGLWHGAGLNFIIWGGLHGFALVINHLWRSLCLRFSYLKYSLPKPLPQMITFFVVINLWVFFRASGPNPALKMFQAMYRVGDVSWGALAMDSMIAALAISCIIVFLFPSSMILFRRYRLFIWPEHIDVPGKGALRWLPNRLTLIATAFIFGFACFYQSASATFLYWSF